MATLDLSSETPQEPSVVGAPSSDVTPPPPTAEETDPAKSGLTLGGLVGYDIADLWGGGWGEFVDDDADEIGEAYEAGVYGGILGADDADPTTMQKKDKEVKKRMTAKGLVSNFVLSIVGSTTLGLTSQMRGGWLLPPLMVIAGGLIVCENTLLVTSTLSKLQAEKGVTISAYPDFANAAFGIWGKRLASVTSMCALLGMMFTFLVLEAQNFNFVFPINLSWFGCDDCGHKWWALLLTPIGVLYCFGNPGVLMKKVAFLGPLVCFLTVLLAWVGGIMGMSSTAEIPESCRGSRHFIPPLNSDFLLHIAEAGGYGFYSFAVIVTVPTLRNQMKDESKTPKAAIFAYLLALVMLLPIMFLGYAGFADLAPENLIDGMRHNRPPHWWTYNRPFETGEITIAGSFLDFVVTINILLTEAIYIPCTVMAIEASFPNLFRRGPAWRGKAMRVVFLLLRFLVATTVESFVALSALVSSMFCVCNNILIPIVAFHYTGAAKDAKVGTKRTIVHGIIFAFGVFIMIIGTTSACLALLPHEIKEPGEEMREGISSECMADSGIHSPT